MRGGYFLGGYCEGSDAVLQPPTASFVQVVEVEQRVAQVAAVPTQVLLQVVGRDGGRVAGGESCEELGGQGGGH